MTLQHHQPICTLHQSIVELWPRLTWSQQARLVVEVWSITHPVASVIIIAAAALVGCLTYYAFQAHVVEVAIRLLSGGVKPLF